MKKDKIIKISLGLLIIIVAFSIFVTYFLVFPIIDKTSCENDLNRTKEDYKICNSQLTSYIQSEKGLNEKIGNLAIDNSKLNSSLSDCETNKISLENKTRECNYTINNYSNIYIIKSLVLSLIIILPIEILIRFDIKDKRGIIVLLLAIIFYAFILLFWK